MGFVCKRIKMRRHPLEVGPNPGAKKVRFQQPRFPQIGPAGDGPRIILAAQSGMGKSSAAAVLFKAYLPIVERAHIISSTLYLDKAYEEPMRMLKEKYKTEGVDIDDPEENPFHEDLSNLKVIMAGMVKRTREAQEQGDSVMPLTFLWIDDLMTGTGVAGYRYNSDIDKLFSTSRHAGGVVCLLTQSYRMLSKTARLQATHLGVWAVQQAMWDDIRGELAGRQGMSKEQLESAWRTATQRPHGFLWISYNAPLGEKFWSGFTKKLVAK